MKTSALLLTLVTFCSLARVSGQEIKDDINKKWSASISYSRVTNFIYYNPRHDHMDYIVKEITVGKYPRGINVEISRQIDNRISLTSGINFKSSSEENLIGRESWVGFYSEKSTKERYFIEMPISFRYKLLAHAKRIDPYLKSGLRASYFKGNYVGEFTNEYNGDRSSGPIDKHEDIFFVFMEIGAGSYLNLSKSIAFFIGTNLTYSITRYGYLEFQTGLKYSF